MRLLPKPFGYVVSGEVLLEGRDLLKLTAEEMRHVPRKPHFDDIFKNQ